MARVATKGTAQASASSDQSDNGKADTGTWTAGKVLETADSKLSVGGAAVLHQAACTFTFVGTKGQPPTQTAVNDSSTVTLGPKKTTLQASQTAVLLDGDSAEDSFGNTVKISVPASSKLASS
jgi:hypothetical protein